MLFPVVAAEKPDVGAFTLMTSILGVLMVLSIVSTYLNLDYLLSAPLPVDLTGIGAQDISPILIWTSMAFGVLVFIGIFFYCRKLYN
jgi:hypothetical protein